MRFQLGVSFLESLSRSIYLLKLQIVYKGNVGEGGKDNRREKKKESKKKKKTRPHRP